MQGIAQNGEAGEDTVAMPFYQMIAHGVGHLRELRSFHKIAPYFLQAYDISRLLPEVTDDFQTTLFVLGTAHIVGDDADGAVRRIHTGIDRAIVHGIAGNDKEAGQGYPYQGKAEDEPEEEEGYVHRHEYREA